MSSRIESSRQRFDEFRQEFRDNPGRPGSYHSRRDDKDRGPRLRSTFELIRRFFGLLEGHRRAVLFSLGTLTVSTVLALVPPGATKFLVDYVLGEQPLPESLQRLGIPSEPKSLLLLTIGVVGVVSLLKIALHLWGRWHATRAVKRIQLSVRRRAFQHAIRLPLNRVQEIKSGGAASILREDAAGVGSLVFEMLYNPWRAVIQLLGSLLILAWVDWTLLLGALILLPVVYFTHRTWIHRIRPQFRRIRKRREVIDGMSTEIFAGMRVVRAFSRQRWETTRFMRENHLMARQELFVWWWARTIDLVWQIIMPLASAALMLYGGWRVLDGALTLGDLMMFLAYAMMLLGPLGVLAQSAAQFQNSLSGLDRILDLLDEPREMRSEGTRRPVDKHTVRGALSLRNINFQYPQTDEFALRDVSLDVEPGMTVALVGPSGSGKTTLCNLIARFYAPTSGTLLLDGTDVDELDVESYRGLLGIVEQDVFLFDGTIADNIRYAKRHCTAELLREAAAVANALEFIDPLPDGMNTIIGERGVRLSGGQRQRLAIARAVLADPRILILDEATSNLDTESERLIQDALQTLIRDRTCFVIAHRLSTIAHADKIVVVEDGRIAQTGTHDELMQRGGRYEAMVRLQTSRYEDAAMTES